MMNDEELDEVLEESETVDEAAEPATEGDGEAEPMTGTEQEPEAPEDKTAKELAETKEKLLRTMAEYDNYRKRTAREKEELRAAIITDVTSKFLPVLDNLERAISTECADENYKKGVEMINTSFLDTLKALGVEEIESDGAPFDHNLHQAVQRVADSGQESGTVVQTFAKGYKIGDKVIRFAMVSVAE